MPNTKNPHLREIAETLGVSVEAFDTQGEPHLLHASENGDRWLLQRGRDGSAIVRHVGNPASGQHVEDVSVVTFLARDAGSPQHQALAALVEHLATAFLAD